MQTKKRDLDHIFAQQKPAFLNLIKTDPEAALAEFERCARPWLSAHPTPSMLSLTAVEQQDVIQETIDRCLAKNGEPIQNYTDMWASFGEWLSSVAENTCTTRYRSRASKQKPQENTGQPPAAVVQEPVGTSAGPAASAPPRAAKTAASPARRRPPSDERPSRALYSFFEWVRSPRVLIPITIVVLIVAVRAIQTSRNPSRGVPGTTGPIEIALLTGDESRNPQYDVLDLGYVSAGDDVNVPMTAVFRSGRLTVLRLATSAIPEGATPNRIVVENNAGEIAWDYTVDPGLLGEGELNLRIDPNTIVPGDYEIRVLDPTDAVVLRSAFSIFVQ